MTEKDFSISVIMPVYKVSGYIGRSIESLVTQTYKNFEIILVDDCGGDDSIEKATSILNVHGYSNNNDIVTMSSRSYKIVINAHNQGVSLSRQNGMLASNGEYIIHLDSDDYFEPDLLERLISTAKASSSDLVICNYFKERPSESSRIETSTVAHPLISEKEKTDYVKEMLRAERPSALWNKLVKRELFDRAGIPFKINLRDDLSASPLLVLHANKVDFVSNALVHYVLYNSNSESVSFGHLKLIANTLKMLESRFEEMEISMEDEFLSYKAITKRKMIIHPGISGKDLDMALSLFPEINFSIRDGKNPEKKIHYRILLKLSVNGNTIPFRIYRQLLKFLLSL
jgi:glycosyltransferase involved in cell wall biosynthesis